MGARGESRKRKEISHEPYTSTYVQPRRVHAPEDSTASQTPNPPVRRGWPAVITTAERAGGFAESPGRYGRRKGGGGKGTQNRMGTYVMATSDEKRSFQWRRLLHRFHLPETPEKKGRKKRKGEKKAHLRFSPRDLSPGLRGRESRAKSPPDPRCVCVCVCVCVCSTANNRQTVAAPVHDDIHPVLQPSRTMEMANTETPPSRHVSGSDGRSRWGARQTGRLLGRPVKLPAICHPPPPPPRSVPVGHWSQLLSEHRKYKYSCSLAVVPP